MHHIYCNTPKTVRKIRKINSDAFSTVNQAAGQVMLGADQSVKTTRIQNITILQVYCLSIIQSIEDTATHCQHKTAKQRTIDKQNDTQSTETIIEVHKRSSKYMLHLGTEMRLQ